MLFRHAFRQATFVGQFVGPAELARPAVSQALAHLKRAIKTPGLVWRRGYVPGEKNNAVVAAVNGGSCENGLGEQGRSQNADASTYRGLLIKKISQ
jgi:hypothetical protein